MKKYIVKYIYSDGKCHHLGIAVTFTNDFDECNEIISKKIKEIYGNESHIIKFSHAITELTDDVIIVK